VFPPSGTVARVSTQATPMGSVCGIDVVKTTYGAVEGLPAADRRTTYVVSALVLAALGSERDDVVAPDTGPSSVVRDTEGKIVGVRRFTR
jgi:hypothetical protein